MKFNETTQDRSYKITFTGIVSHASINAVGEDTAVIDKSGSYHCFNRKSEAEFELVDPMYWPPQENDVWKGDGDFLYHCIGGRLYRNSDGRNMHVPDDLVITANLSLKLLYRKS